jgi:hypothetical protein
MRAGSDEPSEFDRLRKSLRVIVSLPPDAALIVLRQLKAGSDNSLMRLFLQHVTLDCAGMASRPEHLLTTSLDVIRSVGATVEAYAAAIFTIKIYACRHCEATERTAVHHWMHVYMLIQSDPTYEQYRQYIGCNRPHMFITGTTVNRVTQACSDYLIAITDSSDSRMPERSAMVLANASMIIQSSMVDSEIDAAMDTIQNQLSRDVESGIADPDTVRVLRAWILVYRFTSAATTTEHIKQSIVRMLALFSSSGEQGPATQSMVNAVNNCQRRKLYWLRTGETTGMVPYDTLAQMISDIGSM